MTSRYKAYPAFSTTSEFIIEDFPEHWSLTRIKFNSQVKARVGWHGLKSDDFTDVGPYLVTGSDFKGKFIQWKDCYHCDEERYEQDPYIQLTNGDLLITKDGTIGKVALVSELNGKATLNSGVFVVRPLRSDFTTQYYYWLLLSRAFTDFVDYYKTGSTIAHLYQETFVNFKYPLPPYEEQQLIANFLDHETAKIDTLITKQEKLIELLKEKRQAVISHAVTKGLNPDAPMKHSGVEWLGEVPEHWNLWKFGHFAPIITCGVASTPTYVDESEGMPFLSAQNIQNNKLSLHKYNYIPNELHQQLTKYRKPERGDILVTRVGAGIGAACVIDIDMEFSIYVSLTHIRVKPEIADSKFITYFFGSDYSDFLNHDGTVTGGGVGNLNVQNVVRYKVPLPPLKEQRNIVAHIEQIVSKIDVLVEKAEKAIYLSRERKTALISAAVTGKIDVRDWQGAH